MKSVVNYKYYDVIRYPVVTEKSNMVGDISQYTFVVDLNANKHQIKDAVEKIFNVKVLSVNTLIRKGKKKIFKGRSGVQSDVKKAMVRIESGQRIELTAGV